MLTLTRGTLTSSGAHGDNFGHLLSRGSAVTNAAKCERMENKVGGFTFLIPEPSSKTDFYSKALFNGRRRLVHSGG